MFTQIIPGAKLYSVDSSLQNGVKPCKNQDNIILFSGVYIILSLFSINIHYLYLLLTNKTNQY